MERKIVRALEVRVAYLRNDVIVKNQSRSSKSWVGSFRMSWSLLLTCYNPSLDGQHIYSLSMDPSAPSDCGDTN